MFGEIADEHRHELCQQAGLSDPGFSADHHHGRLLKRGSRERVPKCRQLVEPPLTSVGLDTRR
jgi:hypothetical protein